MKISKRDKGTTGVICFFLGVLGMHRFYVGKNGTGGVQLAIWVLGWVFVIGSLDSNSELTGVGAILLFGVALWVLVDFIMIVTGKFTDINGAWVERGAPDEDEPKPRPQPKPAPRPVRKPVAPPASTESTRLQQRILMAANQSGGAITPTTVAMRTGFDVDVVKDHLETLVDKGYAELQPSKDGAVVYVFRDMLTDEKREELELL